MEGFYQWQRNYGTSRIGKKPVLHSATNLKNFVDNGRAIIFAEGKGVTGIPTFHNFLGSTIDGMEK